MLFHSILTLFAVTFQAGKGLSAHTDTIADFDAFADFGSDSDGFADDFVADADSFFGESALVSHTNYYLSKSKGKH